VKGWKGTCIVRPNKKTILSHWISDGTYSVLANHLHPESGGWDSIVGIVIHYELDSPGFDFW
jgi:hypothetical protein